MQLRLPTSTSTTDDDGSSSDSDGDDDDGDEIVLTARKLAEINGVLVLEGEDEDGDALACPLLRRYHEGSLRVLVRERPFWVPPRGKAGEFDMTVQLVEAAVAEQGQGEAAAAQEVSQQLVGWSCVYTCCLFSSTHPHSNPIQYNTPHHTPRRHRFFFSPITTHYSPPPPHTHNKAAAYRVRVRRHFTVDGLTRLLHRHYPGIPSPRRGLALFYHREPLLHDRRLASYGIGRGAVLTLRVEPIQGEEEEDEETASVASSSAASTAAASSTSSATAALPDDAAACFDLRVCPAGGESRHGTPLLLLRCSPSTPSAPCWSAGRRPQPPYKGKRKTPPSCPSMPASASTPW